MIAWMRNRWHKRFGRSRRVVMFHVGRSGSQVVGDMIKQHPQIDWAHEIFLKYIDVLPERSAKWEPMPIVAERAAMSKRHWFGMEVKFFHLDSMQVTLPNFLDALDGLDFTHFIALERQNLLRKVVSSAIAHQTKRWHLAVGEIPKKTAVVLNIDAVSIDTQTRPLIDFLNEYDRRFRDLKELLATRQALWLTYEMDVFPGPEIAYQKVCHFLEVPPTTTQIRYTRSNPFPLTDLIANYDEVAQALAPTPYGWMLTA